MKEYEIHPLANIVAMAGDREQEALKRDIETNGQNSPVVLWEGKIVDGRCRQRACKELGLDLVTTSLDSSLSEGEVALVVKSLNTRRNLTETQKIASAYLDQVNNGITIKEAAGSWAVSERSLQNFKYVAKRRPEFVKPLFDGDSVKVVDPDKGYPITTSKVNTLARVVKKTEEENKVEVVKRESVEGGGYSVSAFITTEVGKEEHKRLTNSFKYSSNKDDMFSAVVAELMNYKYRIGEE